MGATGIMRITSAANPGNTFTFNALDHSAYSLADAGNQALAMVGWRQGQVVGTNSYNPANTSLLVTSGGNLTYPNWTKEFASNLLGCCDHVA